MFHLQSRMDEKKAYIIAEMSANHAGDLQNALEIVRRTAQAGADCLKIQTYTADTLTIQCDAPYFHIQGGLWDGYQLYDLYRDAATPWEWTAPIAEECQKNGIDFLSTPFDQSAVDFLEAMGCEAYKVASFELVDIPLIEYIAAKGKWVILSCGMGSLQEIQEAVDACHRMGNRQVALLKCCSEYPAKPEDMHLANIPDMAARFQVPVGLSDHSLGSLAAVVGVSLGACIVEKHVCLSRKIKNPDSEFSMEMSEFADMVRDIRQAEAIRGDVSYQCSPSEQASTVFRRSLFAVADIAKGEQLTAANVRSIRPGYGMKPKHLPQVLGKTAAADIPRGTPLTEDLIVGFSIGADAQNE